MNHQQHRKRDRFGGFGQRCHDGQLHQDFRFAQFGLHSGPGRRDALGQPFVPDRVHAFEMGVDVFQVNRHRQQMIFVGPGQVQQTLDIGQGFTGLLFDTGTHVVANLPGQVNSAVVQDDLTHAVIGELALD